jgi:23S rRNA pseudouridine2605 synthase
MTMRLNKYIASCGVTSRRGAEQLVLDNKVTLNGKPVKELGTQVDEHKDCVRISGQVIKLQFRKIYIILNKPKGYITTANDERGRKTVFDLVKINSRVFPVGRLDAGSEGLLLLTNDGDLANRLLHPKYKMKKKYRAKLNKPFNPDDFDNFKNGIELEDGLTAPSRAAFYSDDPTRIEVIIHEGKNRQVRRMFEAIGYEIRALKRVQFGPLYLNKVARGKWRHLEKKEVWQLFHAKGPTDGK